MEKAEAENFATHRIRELFDRARLTHAELAKKSGLSINTTKKALGIPKSEKKDKSKIHPNSLTKLTRALENEIARKNLESRSERELDGTNSNELMTAENWAKQLSTLISKLSIEYSPEGKKFEKDAIASIARQLTVAQKTLSILKKTVEYSTEG